MGAVEKIIKCSECKECYDITLDEYIKEDGRCWKCHVTEIMVNYFEEGIPVNGKIMKGNRIKYGEDR